jgi:hypothetical protein
MDVHAGCQQCIACNAAAAQARLHHAVQRLKRPLNRRHLAGEGGGEHDRLAVGADVVDNAVDLRLEAHVEHAVRLVQHLRVSKGMGEFS